MLLPTRPSTVKAGGQPRRLYARRLGPHGGGATGRTARDGDVALRGRSRAAPVAEMLSLYVEEKRGSGSSPASRRTEGWSAMGVSEGGAATIWGVGGRGEDAGSGWKVS